MNIKKPILFSVAAMLIVTTILSSCSKIENAIINNISWKGVDIVVNVPPVSDTTMQNNIGTGSFTYNLDSFIKANTAGLVGLSNLDTLVLTSCSLTINNPGATNNFANFQQCALAFSTTTNPSSVTMASITNNPDTYAATLNVPVNTGVNLKSYLSSNNTTTVNYALSGKLRRAVTDSLSVNVHVEYHIHVK